MELMGFMFSKVKFMAIPSFDVGKQYIIRIIIRTYILYIYIICIHLHMLHIRYIKISDNYF